MPGGDCAPRLPSVGGISESFSPNLSGPCFWSLRRPSGIRRTWVSMMSDEWTLSRGPHGDVPGPGDLGVFTPERPQLTLAQIGRLTGLRHATAHRLVGELTAWGALERVAGGAYVIGLRLWELGALNPEACRCASTPCPSWKTCTRPRSSTCNWLSSTAPTPSSSNGSPRRERSQWCPRWADGCPCTRPPSARCCWPTPTRTFSPRS
ncbi:helix-turn-helix domain-containing protein [Nonomuraea sp. NPDC049480]|uniref:helix-turn-helix domain-containing protein n=1 Tax=Nonomuraea sp. NPDC049480 TaxID=3364353 RepID=UPI0037A99215